MERRGVRILVSSYTRTEQFLGETIRTLEDLARSCSLAPRRLESMMGKLRGIRRTMQRLDKTSPSSRVRFWKLSRRAVSIAVRIARVLSST